MAFRCGVVTDLQSVGAQIQHLLQGAVASADHEPVHHDLYLCQHSVLMSFTAATVIFTAVADATDVADVTDIADATGMVR